MPDPSINGPYLHFIASFQTEWVLLVHSDCFICKAGVDYALQCSITLQRCWLCCRRFSGFYYLVESLDPSKDFRELRLRDQVLWKCTGQSVKPVEDPDCCFLALVEPLKPASRSIYLQFHPMTVCLSSGSNLGRLQEESFPVSQMRCEYELELQV